MENSALTTFMFSPSAFVLKKEADLSYWDWVYQIMSMLD
jgi:hypothetical protein